MQVAHIPSCLLMSAAAAVLLVGAAAAGEAPAASQDAATAPPAQVPAAGDRPAPPPREGYRIRANDVIGRSVENASGESIGTIEDLLIADSDVHAIVSVGGFLGVGDKLVAVRYGELRRGPGDALVLDATKEELERRLAFKYRDAAASGGQMAAAGSRQDYERTIGERIDSWAQKVSEFTGEAAREGEHAGRQAADKVGAAWNQVEAQWGRLKGASADAWDGTKAAFERAWDDFQRAWRDATET